LASQQNKEYEQKNNLSFLLVNQQSGRSGFVASLKNALILNDTKMNIDIE